MLYYEIVIDPAIVSKEYLPHHEVEKEFFELILKNVIKQGSVVSFIDQCWFNHISVFISKYDDEDTDESQTKKYFQEIFKAIEFKNKLISYPRKDNSLQWIDATKSLSPHLPFFAYIGQEYSSVMDTPKSLYKSERWSNTITTTTKYAIQNNDYIESEIKHVIYNAQHIEIIDPYFNILEERYINTLFIITNILNHNLLNRKSRITIHVKNSRDKKIDVSDDRKYLELWQQEIKKYAIEIKLLVWKETKYKMHDRHIIRDENFCITLPAGIDERSHNKSAWHVESDNNIDEIINDHRIESSPYDLVVEVTKNNIQTWVNGVLQKNSHLSIEEKVANKKVLPWQKNK